MCVRIARRSKMSEFSKITVREEPGKFAGLDLEVALKIAEECLSVDALEIVRRKMSGSSVDEIADSISYSRGYILETIERAKVDIATHRIANWEPLSTDEQVDIMRSAVNGIRKYGRH